MFGAILKTYYAEKMNCIIPEPLTIAALVIIKLDAIENIINSKLTFIILILFPPFYFNYTIIFNLNIYTISLLAFY